MNTIHDDNEQMEYLRRQRIKKEEQIKLRKEKYRALLKKVKTFFGFKTVSRGKTR